MIKSETLYVKRTHRKGQESFYLWRTTRGER